MSKAKLLLGVVGLAAIALWMRSSGGEAPLRDGLSLTYEWGGTLTRVRFTEVEGDLFRVEVEFANPDGPIWSGANATGNGVMVTSRLRTTGGGVFELASLGPLWIPPGQVKEGGRAHGTRVAEVRSWRGWEVGVVRASVGMGAALRGEWYYEKTTGLLVGGTKSTAITGPGEGQTFALIESNLEGLGPH